MNTLRIKNVNFGYRSTTKVLTDFTLTLPSGKTVLLGPNGAGKTSLISLCASVLKPDNGSIELQGVDDQITSARHLRAYREKVAWMPQDFTPVGGLNVREHIEYAAWLKGLTRRQAKRNVDAALESVELGALADRSARALSGGQRQRLGLAGALAHNAQIILLDEPSAGLDPIQRDKLRLILSGIAEDKILLVSTHQTEDIDGSYNNVVVLSEGQIKYQGAVGEFLDTSKDPSTDQRDRIRSAYTQLVRGEA